MASLNHRYPQTRRRTLSANWWLVCNTIRSASEFSCEQGIRGHKQPSSQKREWKNRRILIYDAQPHKRSVQGINYMESCGQSRDMLESSCGLLASVPPALLAKRLWYQQKNVPGSKSGRLARDLAFSRFLSLLTAPIAGSHKPVAVHTVPRSLSPGCISLCRLIRPVWIFLSQAFVPLPPQFRVVWMPECDNPGSRTLAIACAVLAAVNPGIFFSLRFFLSWGGQFQA